jgi:hypothetical protein
MIEIIFIFFISFIAGWCVVVLFVAGFMGAMVVNFGKYIAVLEVITMKFHTIKNIKNQPNETIFDT